MKCEICRREEAWIYRLEKEMLDEEQGKMVIGHHDILLCPACGEAAGELIGEWIRARKEYFRNLYSAQKSIGEKLESLINDKNTSIKLFSRPPYATGNDPLRKIIKELERGEK